MSALGQVLESREPYPQRTRGVQTPARAALLLAAVLATLLPAVAASAQDPDAAPAAPRRVRLHVGALDATTPAARSLAADVARLAAQSARAHAALDVTADPPETWQNPALLRHEGELLKCLNPWAAKPQVLTCVDALAFPAGVPATPAGTSYLVEGLVASSDAGLVVTLTLFPMLDGAPGPAMVTRQATVTTRLRRPVRERALLATMEPLWDAALGKVGRPGAGK